MQITFTLTPAQLKNAKHLYYSRVHSRTLRATAWLPIALGAATALATLVLTYLHPERSRTNLLIDVCAFTSVGFGARRRLREFGPEPDYRDQQVIDFQSNVIVLPTLRREVPWTKISRLAENDEMFLLVSPWPWGAPRPSIWRSAFQAKPVVFIAPKAAFSPGEADSFRALLRDKLSIWAKRQNAPDTMTRLAG